MRNIPIYISTCDKTKHVLKPAIALLEKYWNFEKTVKIVGYADLDINLPAGYTFSSARQAQESINAWANDIYTVLQKETSKHVVFMLDDMLQTDYFNTPLFKILLEKCQTNENIIRCCLGRDIQQRPHIELANFGGATLVEAKENTPYRNVTQPSLWRTDYLLTVLRSATNPWDFEMHHNGLANGKRIIGTKNVYVSSSLIETALSGNHPGKFNILGMKFEDVLGMIEAGMLITDELQYGQKPGLVPQFSEYGFNFALDILKDKKYQSTQIKDNLFTYYSKLYGHIYK